MKVGIIGCGVVGKTLADNLKENEVEVLISDPEKGYDDDVNSCDACFVCINVDNDDSGRQDIDNLIDVVNSLPEEMEIFVRSTVLPDVPEMIEDQTGHENVYYMPEFLTERTADEDFKKQNKIVTSGGEDILKKLFPNKEIVLVEATDACLAKYMHNIFGAFKVTFFNLMHHFAYSYTTMCDFNYKDALEGALASGYINETHTQVPGPDGKLGYGGKCFPKDVEAFLTWLKDNNYDDDCCSFIEKMVELNDMFRNIE